MVGGPDYRRHREAVQLSQPADERHGTWRIAPTAAWVDAEVDGVAIIDLREPRHTRPVLVGEPGSRLWRRLGQGPANWEELSTAARAPDAATARDFVEHFTASLVGEGLLEVVTHPDGVFVPADAGPAIGGATVAAGES